MSVLNEGRNEIRFNNSDGKCLLENWVEERAVAPLDPTDLNGEFTSSAQLFRSGHRGLLCKESDPKGEYISTFTDSYRKPEKPGVRQVGKKQELMEQMLFEKVSQEVHTECNPPAPKTDFCSVTMADYTKEFVSERPKPTVDHDYKTEQPVTFWSEHKDRITGVTQVKTRDTAFRRNDGFSKPIDEYWNQPMPYEIEDYPKM